eukprot:6405467-Prymnesium_polylepis.1
MQLAGGADVCGAHEQAGKNKGASIRSPWKLMGVSGFRTQPEPVELCAEAQSARLPGAGWP